MGKANSSVSVPGAPADTSVDTGVDTATDDASAGQVAEKDAEIARLRALLAAAQGPAEPMVMEADGPNTRRYKAESKHLHLTTGELHAKVMGGEIALADHHVLCKDGWYVNLAANAHANG